MRIPLFMAIASGKAAQYLTTLPQLNYDTHEGVGRPSLYVSEHIEFLLYQFIQGGVEGMPPVVSFDLGPASNGDGGLWGIWILYPSRCTRAQVKAVYDGLVAHNATLPSGSTLGPWTPKNLPAVGKALINDIMPMVIAGDNPTEQMLLDDGDLNG
jgi:hypothetical protein